MKFAPLGFVILVSTVLTILFLVSSAPSVEAQSENVGIRGDHVTISATLLQNGTYGIPVPNQVIEFYDQTQNLFLNNGTTNHVGVASIEWNIPLDYPLGPTILNATYRGNESLFLSPSCQLVTITILSSTRLTIEYEQGVLAPEDFLSIEALILDDSLNPIQYDRVSVYCDNVLLATTITDISGRALFSIHCNDSWSILGENTVTVIYEQDLENYHSRAEALFTIEIRQVSSQIFIEPFPDKLILCDELDIDIVLSETAGGISAELEIFLDGNLMTTIITDNYGNAVLNLDIDERFSLGSHIIQIKYSGNNRYQESIENIHFDVTSFVFINYVISQPVIINYRNEFRVEVYDMLSRSVNGTIYLIDHTNGNITSNSITRDSTELLIPFQPTGPIGLHNLSIELENLFILNGSKFFSLVVWSLPTIEILNTNIFHYASPHQEIIFLIHLTDFLGNASFKDIQLLLDNKVVLSSLTDENGKAVLTTDTPYEEGTYNYSIFCPENISRYELDTKLDYQLIVNKQIPTVLNLYHYEIIPPLQIILIKGQIICLNGSLLEGINVKLRWLSTEEFSTTQERGEVTLRLSIPNISGNYSLYYEIGPTPNLTNSSGTINLFIDHVSILASQGVGIGGFVVALTVSSTLFMIPIIRKRYPM
ncbi:hypothetical protein EU527_00275 [Candidatus Thorarchaeota archaeon]|nr:MAG: hypothetical protein EU527_00275 [Candidatus Thorarchaeota archaeon]